jgi:malonate decarboxylase epsilon subunit
MKTAFLFPGQGAQKANMLQGYSLADAITKEVFLQTEEQTGLNPLSLDTEEQLLSTVNTQLCLLIAGVISARRLQAKGVSPDFVAGHSVGAFAAAVISGALTYQQAVSLVHLRATLMEQAYPQGYGMAALTGLSETTVKQTLDVFNREHTPIYLSNINSRDQLVVSGRLSDLEELIRQLQATTIKKAQLLHVSVPSHSPLLNKVATALKTALDQFDLAEPLMPYISNHTGRLLKTKEAIRTDLYKSIAATVKWYDGTTLLYELGCRLFIEMEPSGVLAKIAEVTFPEANVLALSPDNMESVTWLWEKYREENN